MTNSPRVDPTLFYEAFRDAYHFALSVPNTLAPGEAYELTSIIDTLMEDLQHAKNSEASLRSCLKAQRAFIQLQHHELGSADERAHASFCTNMLGNKDMTKWAEDLVARHLESAPNHYQPDSQESMWYAQTIESLRQQFGLKSLKINFSTARNYSGAFNLLSRLEDALVIAASDLGLQENELGLDGTLSLVIDDKTLLLQNIEGLYVQDQAAGTAGTIMANISQRSRKEIATTLKHEWAHALDGMLNKFAVTAKVRASGFFTERHRLRESNPAANQAYRQLMNAIYNQDKIDINGMALKDYDRALARSFLAHATPLWATVAPIQQEKALERVLPSLQALFNDTAESFFHGRPLASFIDNPTSVGSMGEVYGLLREITGTQDALAELAKRGLKGITLPLHLRSQQYDPSLQLFFSKPTEECIRAATQAWEHPNYYGMPSERFAIAIETLTSDNREAVALLRQLMDMARYQPAIRLASLNLNALEGHKPKRNMTPY